MLPHSGIQSWLHEKSNQQKWTMVVFMDKLDNADISPLIDVLMDAQHLAIDIICKSSCLLSHESTVCLLHAASSKLRVLDLQYANLSEDTIHDIFQGGLDCHVMKLRFNHIQTLHIAGNFQWLISLNLDFCSSLNAIHKDFYAHMPNLMQLSMCGTSISNLWTTSAALSRLTSLVELRFQNCMCCKGTMACPASSDKEDTLIPAGDSFATMETRGRTKISTDDRLLTECFEDLCKICSKDLTLTDSPACNVARDEQNVVSNAKFHVEEESESPTSVLRRDQPDWTASETYVLQCPSPICFERHYREYMITTLPSLQVLDNLLVTTMERDTAKSVISMSFEHLPYKRQFNESITSVLHSRETGSCSVSSRDIHRTKQRDSHKRNQIYYSRSLLAAKLASSASPSLLSMSRIGDSMKHGIKSLRARQLEYHPSDPSLMAFGTLDGEVVIMNHEKGSIVKCFPSFRESDRALSLCWLNKHPSKLLAGFDNGALRLYDINQVASMVKYDDFEKLTSVHVNAMDEKFLASNYSRNVAIFDMCSGARLQFLSNIHQEPINVAKFTHHSPNLLVTSSFDRHVKLWDLRQTPLQPCYSASSSKGNVMACFSSDDLYILVSAVDNEVRQLLAVDGRLHTNFDIVSTGSSHNYTRSYYMNGRDYVISGSSEESVVRVCCGQTGRRLRDVCLKDTNDSSVFVHSLRSDPFRHFNMAVLAGSRRPASPWDIIKVNMLASNHSRSSNTD